MLTTEKPSGVQTIDSTAPMVEFARRRLNDLATPAEDDVEGPTPAASGQCLKFFTAVDGVPSLACALPRPVLNGLDNGALYCEWRKRDKRVIALISPTGTVHLHQVTVADNTVTNQQNYLDPGPATIRQVLSWFADVTNGNGARSA